MLSLTVGLALVSIAPAQSASAAEHARAHAADKAMVKVALGEDDEVVLLSRVAAAIERTLKALDRSEERVDDARYRRARKSLKAVRLDIGRAHRAGLRQMTSVPVDEEAESTPGPDSVVAVLTVEQGAVTRLAGMYDTITHHPRVVRRISTALSATLTYRDLMLNAVIALDPEEGGADYADGMADTVDGYADEIANRTDALQQDQLSAPARTALGKAPLRSPGDAGQGQRCVRRRRIGVSDPKAARQGACRGLLLGLIATMSLGLVGCGAGDDATDTTVPAAATAVPAPTAGDGIAISSLSASPAPVEEPTTSEPTDPSPPDIRGVRSGGCAGRIAAVAVDEVRVPAGATCTLEGTKVNGNVSVGRGARFIARGVSVNGDIEAESADRVEVTGRSNIGGNIQVVQGGSATVRDSRIDGDLEWEEQHGRVTAEGNTIGGNLQADGNVGGVSVSGNSIDGDLECQENNPRPTGGGNAVSGDIEDQCAHL